MAAQSAERFTNSATACRDSCCLCCIHVQSFIRQTFSQLTRVASNLAELLLLVTSCDF